LPSSSNEPEIAEHPDGVLNELNIGLLAEIEEVHRQLHQTVAELPSDEEASTSNAKSRSVIRLNSARHTSPRKTLKPHCVSVTSSLSIRLTTLMYARPTR